MSNVEIKAVIKNLDQVNTILKEMKLGDPRLIQQHDEFYNTPQGRLKLRNFMGNSGGELIYYERSDSAGPKLSSYVKATVSAENLDCLSAVLKRALGLQGEVKKTRHLHMLGQTRIHVDFVEDLGNYLELEVVLKEDQSVQEGQEIAESIIKQLNIDREDFIPSAYVDLLRKK